MSYLINNNEIESFLTQYRNRIFPTVVGFLNQNFNYNINVREVKKEFEGFVNRFNESSNYSPEIINQFFKKYGLFVVIKCLSGAESYNIQLINLQASFLEFKNLESQSIVDMFWWTQLYDALLQELYS